MSRIYFHSRSGESEVYGSERAYGDQLVSKIAHSVLDICKDTQKSYAPFLNPKHYVYDMYHNPNHSRGFYFLEAIHTAMRVGWNDSPFILDGKELDIFSMQLNTGIALGSDPVKLYARIHGQCEIHGWIDGKNRKWLAEIIEEGIEARIMRPKVGWEETVKLLKKTNKEEVVMSYSVCDSFPNAYAAGWEHPIDKETGEKDWDAWYDLPKGERWDLSMKGLKKNEGRLLELKPETWKDIRFGEDITALDFKQRVMNREVESREVLKV